VSGVRPELLHLLVKGRECKTCSNLRERAAEYPRRSQRRSAGRDAEQIREAARSTPPVERLPGRGELRHPGTGRRAHNTFATLRAYFCLAALTAHQPAGREVGTPSCTGSSETGSEAGATMILGRSRRRLRPAHGGDYPDERRWRYPCSRHELYDRRISAMKTGEPYPIKATSWSKAIRSWMV